MMSMECKWRYFRLRFLPTERSPKPNGQFVFREQTKPSLLLRPNLPWVVGQITSLTYKNVSDLAHPNRLVRAAPFPHYP